MSSFSISHYYQDVGDSPFAITYPVSVTVTTCDSPPRTITVPTTTTGVNVLPEVHILGAYDASPGDGGTPGVVTLSSIVLDPGDNDSFTYTWTVHQNGVPYCSSSGPSGTYTFTVPAQPANAYYDAFLTVQDEDGGIGTATADLFGTAFDRFQPDQPTVTIQECDAAGDVISDPQLNPVLEGTAAYFLVSVSGNRKGTVTIDYTTQDGTAQAPTDYMPPNNDYGEQSLTFPYNSGGLHLAKTFGEHHGHGAHGARRAGQAVFRGRHPHVRFRHAFQRLNHVDLGYGLDHRRKFGRGYDRL